MHEQKSITEIQNSIFTASTKLPDRLISNKFAGVSVLGLVADNSACGYYRVINPLHYLKQHGAKVDYGSHHSMDNFLKYDNILAPRQHSKDVYEILRFCSWEGKHTFFELDDCLDAVEESSPAYFAYHPGSQDLKMIHKVMSWCDGVTTTTPEMARWCYQNNRNVAIIPNLIDFSFRDWAADVVYDDNLDPIIVPKPIERPKEWEGKIVLMYAGGTCFDDRTEILSENGWKLFKDLNKDEKVATVNPLSNTLEYHKPYDYINQKYSGPMHLVEKQLVNYCVTPNHWMYISKDKLNYEKIQSENIDSDHYALRSVIWEGESPKVFTLPKVDKFQEKDIEINDWLKFFGFWLADGWVSKGLRIQDGRTYPRHEIGLVQKKDGNILSELKDIMSKYGFEFRYTKDGKYLRLQNKQLWTYLSQFGGASEKFVPKEIKILDKNLLSTLFRYYLMGDGSLRGSGYRSFTCSRQLSSDFSEIGLKIGYASGTTNRGKRSGFIKSLNRTIKSNHDQFVNSYSTVDTVKNPKVFKSDIKTINYEGTVHCVTVQNHLIIVRRNGLAMVSGQTHQLDVPILGPQIKRILDTYSQAHFALYMSPVQAQEFVETYKIPQDRLTLIHARHFLDFPKGLHGADISLAPLNCSQFNLAKSNLKILESFAAGAAMICSNVGPYARFNKKHPGYVLLAGSSKTCHFSSLYDAMAFLIENPEELAKRKIRGRQLIIDEYSLEKNIALWPSSWKAITERKLSGDLGPPEVKLPKSNYLSYARTGPNDPCPCQSGLKYSSCCKNAFG